MSQLAKKFAIAAHGDQKYGALPYVTHLSAVANIAIEFEAPPAVCEAAWLHDVLEDTAATYEELERLFGVEVAALVQAVTNREGSSRAEAHASTYPSLREAGGWAVLLKLCDRLANVRASVQTSPKKLAMYRDEFDSFYSFLYVSGEHEDLWAELRRLLADRA